MQPVELHARVEAAFNAGDVAVLTALYEPDAVLVGDDGSVATGIAAIAEVWSGLIGLGGSIAMTTRHAVEVGDVALLSNVWQFALEGAVVASAITSEVARRQPDGSWRYVIDHPYAAPAPLPEP
jgi:ketosteroid isomerase-like protein